MDLQAVTRQIPHFEVQWRRGRSCTCSWFDALDQRARLEGHSQVETVQTQRRGHWLHRAERRPHLRYGETRRPRCASVQAG